jgi:hypothetical protein
MSISTAFISTQVINSNFNNFTGVIKLTNITINTSFQFNHTYYVNNT